MMSKPQPKTAWTAFREEVGKEEALLTKEFAKKVEGNVWSAVPLLSNDELAEVAAMIYKEMGL